jgi:proline dehydrogenase
VLAQAAGKGDARLALGTHDVDLISRIAAMAEAAGTGRDTLEVHMLYGIRTDQLARLAKEGYSCSSLVAYGEFWYAWYMRRLAERPANIAFALRQLLP